MEDMYRYSGQNSKISGPFLPFPEEKSGLPPSINTASTGGSVAPIGNTASPSWTLARSPQTAALLERIAKLQERLGERTLTPGRDITSGVGSIATTANNNNSNNNSGSIPNRIPLPGRGFVALAANTAAAAASSSTTTAVKSINTNNNEEERLQISSGDGLLSNVSSSNSNVGARPRLQASLVGRLLADMHYKDEEIRRLNEKLKALNNLTDGDQQSTGGDSSYSKRSTSRKLEFEGQQQQQQQQKDERSGSMEDDAMKQHLNDSKLRCEALEYELKNSREREKQAIDAAWLAHQHLQTSNVERNGILVSIREHLARAIEEGEMRGESTAILRKELARLSEVKSVVTSTGPIPQVSTVTGRRSSDLDVEWLRERAAEMDQREDELNSRQKDLDARELNLSNNSDINNSFNSNNSNNNNGGGPVPSSAAFKNLEQRVIQQEKAIHTLEIALAEARRVAASVVQTTTTTTGPQASSSSSLINASPKELLKLLADTEKKSLDLREEIVNKLAFIVEDATARKNFADNTALPSSSNNTIPQESIQSIAQALSEFVSLTQQRKSRIASLEAAAQRLSQDLDHSLPQSPSQSQSSQLAEAMEMEHQAASFIASLYVRILTLAASIGIDHAVMTQSQQQSPAVATQSPAVATQSSAVATQSSAVATQSPAVATQPPGPSPRRPAETSPQATTSPSESSPATLAIPKPASATAPVTAARVAQLEAALRERDTEIDGLKAKLIGSAAAAAGGSRYGSEVASLREYIQILQGQLSDMQQRHLPSAVQATTTTQLDASSSPPQQQQQLPPGPVKRDTWEDMYVSRYIEHDDLVDEIDIQELSIGPKIGQGSFAGVFQGTWHRPVAIKMFKTVVNQNQIDAFSREANILRSLRHRSVCRFMGTCTVLPDMYIVMELINGRSLHHILHDGQSEEEEVPLSPERAIPLSDRLSLAEILGLSMQIAQAMCYLHANHIIHRDLKPTNLLIDEFGCVKLIDFGLAFSGDPKDIPENKILAGTPVYLPPEVLREESCSSAVDVFSFAIILWEMCTAELPWRGVECDDMIHRVTVLDERPPIARDFPPGIPELIRSCWHKDPKQRPTFPAITRRLHSLGAPPTPPRPVASFETIQAM